MMPNPSALPPHAGAITAASGLRIRTWVAMAMAVVLVVVTACALTVRYWLWPALADLVNDPVRLEQTVSPFLTPEQLTLEVRGAQAEWTTWLAPRLSISELRLWSQREQKEVLHATSITADFGLRSLLSAVYGVPIFSELSIAGLRVTAEKAGSEPLRLAGFSLQSRDNPETNARSVLKALSLQGPWSIQQASLDWSHASSLGPISGSLPLQDTRLRLADDGLSLQTHGVAAPALSALLGQMMQMPALEGRIGPLRLQWRGALDQALDLDTEQWLGRLRLDAEFSGLGLDPTQASARSPQLRGLSGRLLLSSQQGSLALASESVVVSVPRHLPEGGIRLDAVSGQIEFSAHDLVKNLLAGAGPHSTDVTLAIDKFSARQGDLKIQGQGRYRYAGEGLGSLEADGSLGGLSPTGLKALLPTSMGRNTRAWLLRAVQGGRPVSGSFRIAGPLASFPFRDPQTGDFQVRLRMEDQTLAFSPDWPKITGAFVDLAFDRERLRIESRQALIGSAPITQVVAEIPDLGAARPMLTIQGEIAGSLASIVETANRSPVRGWLDQALVTTTTQGMARLGLALNIDLNNADRTTVQGRLVFNDNRISLDPNIPELTAVRGSIGFSEKGLSELSVSGRALGGPFTAGGMARPAGTSRLGVKGEITAAGLEGWLRGSAGLPLGQGIFSGNAPYALTVDLGPAGVQVNGQSSLRGLAIRLPVPARKRSEEDWGMQFGFTQKADGQARRQQHWKIATVSHQLSADLVRIAPISGAGASVTGRIGIGGAVAPGSSTSPLRTGIVVSVITESLDLSSWIQALETRLAEPASGQSQGAGPLARLEVDAQQVSLGEQQITGVQARAANQSGVWRVDLQSAQVSGQLAWTPKPASPGAGPVGSSGSLVARLQRLWLPPGQATETTGTAVATSPLASDDAGPSRPLTSLAESRRWPTIDLIAEDFRRGNKQFGRLVMDAAPALDQPRWDIRSLSIDNPYGRLAASGQWSASGSAETSGSSRTQLNVSLQVRDGGGLLGRLGYPGVIRATPGSLTGQILWAGAPTDFQLATMEGTLVLDMQSGQFLKADPGLAKLISVVNLQSLPKRITLDFRDIFSEGFVYERVRGSVAFSRGQARTENLRIVGIQASVLLEGQANMLNETQDLRVLVLPEFNAGLASLGYALVNPAVGLGSFIAQYLLRDPLRQALAYEYRISGRWDDPQIKALPRRTVARENKEP